MSITIHVEGLDLAGKSTICRFIRDSFGFQLRNNILVSDNPTIQETDYLRKNGLMDDESLGKRYYDALKYDLDHYNESAERIVQDSTIIVRSIAFHSVLGDPALAESFRELLPRHPRFNRSVVLVASDEVRLKRLEGRCSRKNDSPEDYLIKRDPGAFHRIEDIIIDLVVNQFGGAIVDSSEMEQDGAKDRIAQKILQGVL